MLLENVTLDYFKYEPDVLSVRSTCEVVVDVPRSLRIDIDEHASNELTRLIIVTNRPYTHTHTEVNV